jgi:predicted nucleic acid-binding protein
MLAALAVHAPDPIDPPRLLRDPSDDYLVALARATSTEAIVTGDHDLLEHDGLEPPPLTARQACVQLGLIAG